MNEKSTLAPRQAQLTEALLRLVAENGLDAVSVREVASAGGVAIGTVQHYFPTKDAMLASAFEEVVRRTRSRIERVRLGTDVRRNLSLVLRQLLPLDHERTEEARIQVAFAARAATTPELAEIQRRILTELHEGVTQAFVLASAGRVTPERSRLAAHLAIASVDGLALHAVSAAGWLSGRRMTRALEYLLDLLVGTETD
jgi:AcrR family transcriptional regulator